jgi:two-component system, response regulator, stage 0 sporulation protein F
MKPRILLAETDETVREHWVAALERARFEVEQAQSPRESLYRFCIQSPDLLVLSLEGPITAGLGTIELMRNFNPTCPMVVLVDDAEPSGFTPKPGLELLLKKPLDAPELVNAIKGLVKPIIQQQMEEIGEPVEAELPPTRKRRSSGGRHYNKHAPLIPRTSLQHCG